MISLKSAPDVAQFVAIATAQEFPVSVSDGTITVNGKSFMQMFCLDLRNTLVVAADCDKEQLKTLWGELSFYRVF